jgi:multicomponent Na+:H+ antiporter subunit B
VSRTLRWWVLGVGLAGVGVVLLLAILRLPSFGSAGHPYRDLAVPAAVARHSPNVISSVNFDQRGFDTFGEETIFFGSVVATAALLRPSAEERIQREPGRRPALQAERLFGYLLLPLTLVVGFDVVAHGHLTPGGGFQGGAVLVTGLHLLYVAGRFRSLEKLRPLTVLETAEAVGAAAFALLGFAGLVGAGAFLANILPLGSFGQLISGGTVPVLNIAVGIAIGAGGVVLISPFFEQVFLIRSSDARGESR